MASGQHRRNYATGPIATLVFAYFLLDESISALQLAGTALLLAGIYTLGRSKT